MLVPAQLDIMMLEFQHVYHAFIHVKLVLIPHNVLHVVLVFLEQCQTIPVFVCQDILILLELKLVVVVISLA
jgi:hypothetical protein